MRIIPLTILTAGLGAAGVAGLWHAGFTADALRASLASLSEKPAVSVPKTGGDRQVGSNDQKAKASSDETAARAASGTAKLSFDVIRIDPKGSSVFAGRAAPHQRVMVLMDGRRAGLAKADGEGNWVLISDKKLSKTAKFSVEEARAELAQVESVVIPKVAAGKPQTVAEVQRRMLTKLEAMIANAKRPGFQAAAKVAALGAKKGGSANSAQDVGAAFLSNEAVGVPSVPIPVHFEYRLAEFTPAGRRAAVLLVEYLKARKIERAVLSGHADDRGSHEFNMELSRLRLETVEALARERGYVGELQLIPRGKTQPYAEIDRSKFSREELYQIDRRVELHLK